MSVGSALRGASAVVGVGHTTYGTHPGRSADALAGEALAAALDDAGLSVRDVDGLVVHRLSGYEPVAAAHGIEPRWVAELPPHGRMSSMSVQLAALAVATGQCETVALMYGNNGRSAGETYGGSGEGYGSHRDLWLQYGMTSPGSYYALMLERHQHLFGTSAEQLSAVARAFRRHATLNPDAVMRTPLTRDDYLDARFIVEPMRLFDYCIINDGGVAMIVTRAGRARGLRKPPVWIRGFATASSLATADLPPEDFWQRPLGDATRRAHAVGGVTHADVDALMVYDNFAPNVLFTLEGAGFCEQGESGAWIQDGRIELGGELPVNTSGGHLSESYMQGWNQMVEAVRQLRAECGERQVPGAAVVQYTCSAPIASTIVFGREPS